MTFTDSDRRRRGIRGKVQILVPAALVLLTVVFLVAYAIASRPTRPGLRPGQVVTSALTHRSASSSAGPVLILPPPTGVRNGIPVGFPHTAEGAVSAAAFDIEAFDSLDPVAAENWAHTVAAPGDAPALINEVTKGVAAIRAAAGLPSAGPAYGSYVTYQPRAYQVAGVTSDRLVVWVLASESASSNGSAAAVQPASLGFVVVWAEGDWHLSAEDPGVPPPADQPGTAAAVAHGWRGLAEAP